MDELDFDVDSIAHLLDADATTSSIDPNNISFIPDSQQYPNTLSITNKDLSEANGLEGFNLALGETWIYPINYPLREYQHTIAHEALFKNTLVCLPTGLGKTFIAAVVIYNIYRWYPQGKIVFMAPTKPLVKQQISACMNIASIPEEDIAEITGHMKSRDKIWNEKRVFFITPQVLENDLTLGLFPVTLLRLLVVDEAHHTRGRYSYGEVIRAIRTKHDVFRVLALTATPGKNVEDVIEIINCLQINHMEIRCDNSIDVKPYTHSKNIHTIVVKLDAVQNSVREKYIGILDTYVRRLLEAGVLSGSMGSLHRGRIIMEYKQYQGAAAQGRRHPQHPQIVSDFTMCISLYHGLDLLVNHGYRVFLKFFEESDDKGWLYKESRLQPLIKELRARVGSFDLNVTLPDGGVLKPKTSVDYGHPKFNQLKMVIAKHFAENPDARCIVFCEFRESVNLIHSLLLEIGEPIKPQAFMGTGTASTASPGVTKLKSLTQKQQLMIMQKFRSGNCNVLVSTCVAEEGIDVGEVDLIVCFDTSTKNPTRLTQRMGRTGRQKSGKVVLLVTEGREEMVLRQSMAEKSTMTNRIGNNFQIKRVLQTIKAPRMVPDNLQPRCIKMYLAPPKEQPTIAAESSKENTESTKKASKTGKISRTTRSKNQPDLRDLFNKQMEKQKSPAKKKTTDAENSSTAKTSEKAKSLTKRKSGDLRQYLEISPRKSQSSSDDNIESQDVDVFKIPEKAVKPKPKSKQIAKTKEAVSTDAEEDDVQLILPCESIYDGQDIPSSLADFITKINSDNIKNLIKNECDFCEKVIKCEDKQFSKNDGLRKLDFLKDDFVAPGLDWIKDLSNEITSNEREDSLMEFINEDENCLENACDIAINQTADEEISATFLEDLNNIEKSIEHEVKDTEIIYENPIDSNKQETNKILQNYDNKNIDEDYKNIFEGISDEQCINERSAKQTGKEIINKNSVMANKTDTRKNHDVTNSTKSLDYIKADKNRKIDKNLTNNLSIISYFKLSKIEDIFDADEKITESHEKIDEEVKSFCGSSIDEIKDMFDEDFDVSLAGPPNEKMTQVFMPTPSQPEIEVEPQILSQTSPIFNLKRPRAINKSKLSSSLHSTPKLENDFLKTRPVRRNPLEMWDEESLFEDLEPKSCSSNKTTNDSESMISITQMINLINKPRNEPANTKIETHPVVISGNNKTHQDEKAKNDKLTNIDQTFCDDIIPATQFSPIIQKPKSKLNLGRLKALKTFNTETSNTQNVTASSPYFQKSKATSKIDNSLKNNLPVKTFDISVDLFDNSDVKNKTDIDANKSIDSDETFVDQNEILESIESLLEDVDFEQDILAATSAKKPNEKEKVFQKESSKPSVSGLSSFKFTPRRIEFPDSDDDDVFQNIPNIGNRCSNNTNKKTQGTKVKKRKKSRNNVSQFLDQEAAMSGDEEDHYEDLCDEEDMKSFIDFASPEEKDKTDMTAKYLQSIRSPLKVSGFKVPKATAPKQFLDVFSQIPEPDLTNYEDDSFCVHDEPTVYVHELSELEILEKKLKKSRKNSKQKRKRLKSDSEDDISAIDNTPPILVSDEDSFLPKKSNKGSKRRRIKSALSSSSDEGA